MTRLTLTDAELRARMTADFAGHGGGARLARALGISESAASLLLRGKPSASLVKIAAHYGYEPDGENSWRKSTHPRDPRDVGYRHRWTELVLQDLRALMSLPKSERPRTSDVAKRFGIAQATLRGVMARAHIKLRQEDRS